MKKLLLAFLLALLPASAGAQSMNVENAPPLSGTSMGNGINLGSGLLFLPFPVPSSLVPPIGESYWLRFAVGFNPNPIESIFANTDHSNVNGWLTFWRNTAGQDTFTYQWTPAGQSSACFGFQHLCTRGQPLADHNWHHFCVSSTSGFAFIMVDGVRTDFNSLPAPILPNLQTFYSLGPTTSPATNGPLIDVREVMYRSGRPFRYDECSYIYNLGHNGLIPLTTDPVVQGLWSWWHINDCNIGVSCPDSSGNGRTLIYDTPPTVTILTPSPGNVSGTVSLTASCPDIVQAKSVSYSIDGLSIGTATVAPFTVAWNTATLSDRNGRILTASCINIGNQTATTSITVNTVNSLTSQAWYFSNTGVHGNNCKTPATACPPSDQLTAAGTRFYLDGDTINLDATNGVSLTTVPITICGTTVTSNPLLNCAQNAYSGTVTDPIIIQSYNGSGPCNVLANQLGGCAVLATNSGSTLLHSVYAVNTSSVTVRNLQIPCGPAASTGGVGIRFQSGVHNAAFTVTNNLTKDCGIGVYLSTVHGDTSLYVGNLAVSNNLFTGTTPQSPAAGGMVFQGTVSGIYTSNVCSNLGMFPNTTAGVIGCALASVYQLSTSDHSYLGQNSVSFNIGANSRSCGGPAHFWSGGAANITYQFVEGFNAAPVAPPAITGCDWDFFDQDQNALNSLSQYGYGHSNFGDCMLFFDASPAGGFTWQKNVQRYNICENNGAGVSFAFPGPSNNSAAYGNTIYSNINTTNNQQASGLVTAQAPMTWANNLVYGTGPNLLLISTFNGLPSPQTTLLTNLYYAPAHSTRWAWWGPFYASLAAFQAGTGKDVGSVSTNPLLAAPGAGGNCYSGTGIPTAPQPCPSAYTLTGTGPAYSFATDPTTFNSLFALTTDYYLNAVPNIFANGWNAAVLMAPTLKAEEPYGPTRIPLEEAEDLIATQPKHAEVMAPPLSHDVRNCTPDPSKDLPTAPGPMLCMQMDEFEVLREALWTYEKHDREGGHEAIGWYEPTLFMKLSMIHLLKGLPLRVGDYMSLHGALLAGERLSTFILAKKWQNLRQCYFHEPTCQTVGY